MKKLYLILLLVFILLNTTMAQELKVKGLVLTPTDLTAQTDGRKDLNGDACALVKINFVGNVSDVEGNVIKPLVKRGNETWAYMTQESQQMKVITKDALPLMVTFDNYGIDKLQGNRTYVLTLTKSSGVSESQQMQTLTIRYSPIAASVLVDNKFIKGSNGVAKTSLPIGQHSFVVACDGYESEEGTVRLKSSAPSNLQITLSKEMASVSQSVQSVPTQQLQKQVITIPVKDGISIEMVKVEAGSFNMGATPEMGDAYENEKPTHEVILTNNYYLSRYEVTQAQWNAVMGNNPSRFFGSELPVEQVSWLDCLKFIEKLNNITGLHFRLPTEAEWEFAARGGNKSHGYKYSGSDILSDVAWYKDNGGGKTHSVGSLKPNELGLYDMSGNVNEWCQDEYGKYLSSSQTNPVGSASFAEGIKQVGKGGSWASLNGKSCRPSYRMAGTANAVVPILGIRLALSE